MHVPTGYVRANLRSEFEDALGADHVLDADDVLHAAAIDHYWLTFMWSARGEELPRPLFVVKPRSTAEVSQVVRICRAYQVPLVTRGGGSGTQGGATTPYGGVVVDLTRMDAVLSVDRESLVVEAQAGINGRVLEETLNRSGFMLAHYPSSVDMATLGGYLAARGSGVMSTKYGKAEDMVLSLEVVLPDGRVMNTLRYPNHAAGPGLLQLFVGSEGTLGVITTVRMRIDPLPEHREFQVFRFQSVEQGLEAGRRIMTKRLRPAVIRLYDEAATGRSLRSVGHDLTGVNMVVMTDGPRDLATSEMRHITDICRGQQGVEAGQDEGRHWWDHRYDFYKPPLQPGYPRLYGTVETVTSYREIATLYRAKQQLVTEKYAEWGAQYTAHFSHWYEWGTMIYDRFYIDTPPGDTHQALRLHNRIWADCSRVNLEHGGVLNEHHGIGLKLGWLMAEQGGTAHEVLRSIKDLLDPKGFMNPGKLGL